MGTSRSPKLELIFHPHFSWDTFLVFPVFLGLWWLVCLPHSLEGVCFQDWIWASLAWEFLTHLRTLSRVPCPGDELKHIPCLPLVLSFVHKIQSLPSRNLPSVRGDKAKTHLPLERGENSMKACTVNKCFLEKGEHLEGLDGLIQKEI